jgi:tetratricopeptide (TPR) repeat protein
MQMVEALEKEVEAPAQASSGTGTAAEKLTRIYIEMGTELEDQIKALVAKGDLQGKDALSKAFEQFLDKIRGREKGNTYSSLIWIAETFYGLGKSNTDESGQPNAAAQGYFRRAAETYQKILDRAAADPQFLKNPRQRTTIEMRLVHCYRNLGDVNEALNRLEAILKRKTTNLTVQVQSAEVLFDAGAMQCENFKKAYFGVRPDSKGKNVIWGWRRLADITRPHEKFAPVYLKSVLYGIKCRMEVAICQQNAKPDQKTKLFNAALGTLIAIYREKPQLGGEELRVEYDRIAKKLQGLLGQEQLGLKAYSKPDQPGLEDDTETEEETG